MADEHKCPSCEWTGKTQGALTQHVRKEHKDDPTTELSSRYGEWAPRPGGAYRPDRPLKAAPSGIPSIDYAIGIGGVPRGTIIEIYGKPGTGKTFTALCFSAFAQKKGSLVGFVDAEHALQPTFPKMAGVDLDEMYYTAPPDGDTALNMTRDYVSTGLYDIWTVDSVHACVPRKMLDAKDGIGDENPAALATLMSQGCQAIDHVVAHTNTLCIFINHVKDKPMVQYGRTWFKPGGNALDYYCSVQLRVQVAETFINKQKRQIGHKVRVRVDKSKVSAPHGTAEYDLYYMDGVREDGLEVESGVDTASSWLDVLLQSGSVMGAGGRYFAREDLFEQGERARGEHKLPLGTKVELRERLFDPEDDLRAITNRLVYPDQYVL